MKLTTITNVSVDGVMHSIGGSDEDRRLYPVVVGQGTRLFLATGPDNALELIDSRATPGGVTLQVYRPTGRPPYATATDD